MGNKSVGFYLLGKKAYLSLSEFVSKFGSTNILYVVVGKDAGVDNDYSVDIHEICLRNNISVYLRGEKLKHQASIKFSIGWRWMLDCKNLIVFHDSLLPKYRGFSPLVNMLIEGETELGVTALIASSEYDKGDILNQLSKEITYPIKIKEAIDIVSELYAELLCNTYEKYIDRKVLEGVPQNHSIATYSIWRDVSDYQIDWCKSSYRILRTINALGSPYEGARTYVKNEEIIIDEAQLHQSVEVENRQDNIGKIIFFENDEPVVICGQGLIKLTKYRFSNPTLNKKLSFRSRFESK